MALNLKPSATFRATVQFDMLDGDGKAKPQNFDVDYIRRTKEELKERQKYWVDNGFSDPDIVLDIASGWKLIDGEGKDVPFGRDTVDACCNIVPGLAYEMINKYYQTVGVARAKN